MEIVQFVPGVIVSPNPLTLPNGAPDIDTISGVVIARMQSALSSHAAGATPIAHATTAVAVTHAGADVAQHDDHAHDIITQGTTVAPTFPMGYDAVPGVGQMEDQGGVAAHTLAGGLATGIQNTTVSVHGITQPTDHPAADIVAAIDDHDPADVATAIADHVGADIEVAMTATIISGRTFSLNLDTEAADIVILSYHEVGARVPAS